MRTTRITAVAAGVVILFGGLTACNDKGGDGDKAGGSTGGSSSTGGGGSDAGKDPAQSPMAALTAAKAATDAKKSVKLDGTTEAAAGTQKTKGGLDWSDGTQMNIEVSSGGKGKPMKALYTKDAVYLNMGMPGGKPWMKYTYASLSKQPGGGAMIQELISTANPSQPIEWMTAAQGLKVVGKEDVRGVQATHYTGTISLDVQGKKLSPKTQEALKKQLEKSKTKSEQLDIWIDSNGLLVRKQEKVGPQTSSVYYSDYGTKVDMTPPSASQVTTPPGS